MRKCVMLSFFFFFFFFFCFFEMSLLLILNAGSDVPTANDFSQGILADPPSKDTIVKNAAASVSD